MSSENNNVGTNYSYRCVLSQALPVSEARPAEPKGKARAKAKATAAKSNPKSNAKPAKKKETDEERASREEAEEKKVFFNRLTKAPDSVRKDWGEAKKFPKDHPSRQNLYQLIKSVKGGDYSNCKMIVEDKLEWNNGISCCEGRSAVRLRWTVRLQT